MDTLILSSLKGILTEHIRNLKEPRHKPFNFILVTSDRYYRENFHSDLIAAILGIKPFRHVFFDWIRARGCAELKNDDFENATVAVEECKIDILIKDESSKHCIIIENKINNASDMPRQIPRYIGSQENREYTIDAVIYLSIDGNKRPDKTRWTIEEDHKSYDYYHKQGKLLFLAASNKSEGNDLVDKFLKPCLLLEQTTVEQFTFIRQYIDLLEYLGGKQMDMDLMEKFYKEMLKDDTYASAKSLRDMVKDLRVFRRDRLYNKFLNSHAPFDSMGKYDTSDDCAAQFIGLGKLLPEIIKLDVYFNDDDQSTILFYIPNPKTPQDVVGNILTQIQAKENFDKNEDANNSYSKKFSFPTEDEKLYECIDKLLKAIKDIPKIEKI
jgi:hypothetical protein